MTRLNKIVVFIAYIIVVFFIFAVIDVLLLNRVFGWGQPMYKNFLNDVSNKVEYPYVGFIPKDIAMAEKYSRYYTGNKIYDNIDKKIRIAFFGELGESFAGKSGLRTIADYLEQDLKDKLKRDVVVINYSAGGMHHRQHMHMLLEFMPKFKPDIIIYYGGHNETAQYFLEDPRPGYPFNFYYKNDFQTWKRFLLEYSAIIGILDFTFNIWNIDSIRNNIDMESLEWENDIINNYYETLEMSNSIINTFKSDLFGRPKFMAIIAPVRLQDKYQNEIFQLARKKVSALNYTYDFYNKYDQLPKSVWINNCQVNDEANKLMADELSDLIIEKYLKKYLKNKKKV